MWSLDRLDLLVIVSQINLNKICHNRYWTFHIGICSTFLILLNFYMTKNDKQSINIILIIILSLLTKDRL